MSYEATIRLGPIVNASELVWDEKLEAGRYHYTAGAIRMPNSPVPVVLDHDLERPVGHVRRLDEHDGALHAHTVIDKPPRWLRDHNKASIAWAEDDAIAIGTEGLLVLRGELVEVTLVSPGETPRERTARVVKLTRITEPPPRRRTDLERRIDRALARKPRQTLADLERLAMAELRRRVQAGEDLELVHAQLTRQLEHQRLQLLAG